jgi:uncharacterized membrane protein YraQ (UPF0718 family)
MEDANVQVTSSAANHAQNHGAMPLRQRVIRAALILSALLWASDIVYKIVNDVSYVNRERCILFRTIPKAGFIIFEYFFETVIIVFVGIYIAVLLGRWFLRFQRFFPKNPVTAFLYGSLIPVCACGVIPLLSSMKGRMKFTTTMSFVLAAPVLSPYILVLSFSVLGVTYGVLRIASSFILVMTTAFILGFLQRDVASPELPVVGDACAKTCDGQEGDIYLETYEMFKKLLPFLLVGGALGVLLEFLDPRFFLINRQTGKGVLGVLIWVLIGVPLYLCNGVEVLFLRPLVNHGFPLGTAVAFSLTSTAICTTSIAMLFKTIGKRLTIFLVACVVLISLALAFLINSIV